MNTFGDALRQLMEAKKVSGLKLAEDIGVSPTSVSRILNGQSRPRQVTLSRIMKALCQDRSEEQALLRAYSGLDTLPEEQAVNDERNAHANEERVRRFLEVKTQSILFKRSVARELDKAGIEYTVDYCKGPVSTDFLIECAGRRIAVECKFNVHRDLERAAITAKVLAKELNCGKVLTVTPFSVDDVEDYAPDFPMVTPHEMIETITKVTDV